MTRRWHHFLEKLRRVLAGAKLNRALERHRHAAEKLDTAVKEVLGHETGDYSHRADGRRP